MKYRIYIDETGNPDMKSSEDPNHRFLSLTGIIVNLDYVKNILNPELEKLKQDFFSSHPDDPIVFHRKEMVNYRNEFDVLKNDVIQKKFNSKLLEYLLNWKYVVISVCIDKLEHKNKYMTWLYDPYHYCMSILLERYIFFLEENNSKGDVMSESRGGKEDTRLKKSYHHLFETGTEYIGNERFHKSLTSSQLKVKGKENNISGLQIADLIAHPSRREILLENKLIKDERENIFGDEIIQILKTKYYQKNGKIAGYGKKLLP